MDKLLNAYPVYAPDQVLTNKSLNKAFSFLDQQNRSTRCGLVGHGIVCGLRYSIPENVKGIVSSIVLAIEKGYGSTVDGFLIQLADDAAPDAVLYDSGVLYKAPATLVSDSDLVYPDGMPAKAARMSRKALASAAPAKKLALAKRKIKKTVRPLKAPTGSGTDIMELLKESYELLPSGSDRSLKEGTPLDVLPEGGIRGFVLALYLEITDIKSENCSPEDCDEKGKLRNYRVVPLLVPERLLNTQEYSAGHYQQLQMMRMMDFETPRSAAELASNYLKVNSRNAEILMTNLTTSLSDIGEITGVTDSLNSILENIKVIQELSSGRSSRFIQYTYDFFMDMELAVNELVHRRNCMPINTCNFRSFRYNRMLVLGLCSPADFFTDSYRYGFVEAASVNESNLEYSLLYKAQKRIEQMIEAHAAWLRLVTELKVGVNKIQVNPSRSAPALLGSRALPYYYLAGDRLTVFSTESFVRNWNAHECSNRNMQDIYNYYNYTGSAIKPGLLGNNINEYNFFRIEGHVGLNANDAETEINQLINDFNLPFRTFRLQLKSTLPKLVKNTGIFVNPVKAALKKAAVKKSMVGGKTIAAKAVAAAAAAPELTLGLATVTDQFQQYLQDFGGISVNGTGIDVVSGIPVTEITPDHFRLNVQFVRSSPRIVVISDSVLLSTRTVRLRVEGTSFGDQANIVFPGEQYRLQVVYGQPYSPTSPEVNPDVIFKSPAPLKAASAKKKPAKKTPLKAVTATAGAADLGLMTDIKMAAFVNNFYQPYNFPPVVVTATEADDPTTIATKLVNGVNSMIAGFATGFVGVHPSDIITSVSSQGNIIEVILNKPPAQSYQYYVSPSATAATTGMAHYLSVEYIGGGMLPKTMDVDICFKPTADAASQPRTNVRMQSGTNRIDFPKNISQYLVSPAQYFICGVRPFALPGDTGGGGVPIDAEYNLWPFDAKGNLLFNIFKGAEHLGGVYRGGTFILLTEVSGTAIDGQKTETVIGDISLPWDLEFIKLYRAVAVKLNRKYWKWENAWDIYPPIEINPDPLVRFTR